MLELKEEGQDTTEELFCLLQRPWLFVRERPWCEEKHFRGFRLQQCQCLGQLLPAD